MNGEGVPPPTRTRMTREGDVVRHPIRELQGVVEVVLWCGGETAVGESRWFVPCIPVGVQLLT